MHESFKKGCKKKCEPFEHNSRYLLVRDAFETGTMSVCVQNWWYSKFEIEILDLQTLRLFSRFFKSLYVQYNKTYTR
jgi:hypothetical protein